MEAGHGSHREEAIPTNRTALSEVGESVDSILREAFNGGDCGAGQSGADAPSADDVEMLPMEEVHTPGTKTIEEVADFLKLEKSQTMKALLFVTYDSEGNEDGYVAAFVRGDRELNMTKLVNAFGMPEHSIEFADEEKMGEADGMCGRFHQAL